MFTWETLRDKGIFISRDPYKYVREGAQKLESHWYNRANAGRALAVLETHELEQHTENHFFWNAEEWLTGTMVNIQNGEVRKMELVIETDLLGRSTGEKWVARNLVDDNATVLKRLEEGQEMFKYVKIGTVVNAYVMALRLTTACGLPRKGIAFEVYDADKFILKLNESYEKALKAIFHQEA